MYGVVERRNEGWKNAICCKKWKILIKSLWEVNYDMQLPLFLDLKKNQGLTFL
jgi:hypothetical protein